MRNRYPSRNKYGRRQSRVRRRYLRLALTLATAVLLIVLAVCAIVRTVNDAQLKREAQMYANTFSPGVSINGVALTGYDYDTARQVLSERYEASLSHQVTLSFEEATWTLTPRDMGAYIDLEGPLAEAWAYGKQGDERAIVAQNQTLMDNPVDLSAELTYDETAIHAFVHQLQAEIDREPVNATRSIVDNEKFLFTDSAVGYRLDGEALEQQITQLLLSGGEHSIQIEPQIIEPNPSREQLEAATVLLSECTTSLNKSSSTRNSNVNLALGYFNYLEVKPGEEVSFNRVVGKRTKKNGFKAAPEFAGTQVIEGVGGGVCQASTTVYGAVIRAGLTILERHPHTMTVEYVNASQDAAVSDTDKNLRFKNNTDSTLIFFAGIDDIKKKATVKIYGKPVDTSVRIDIVSNITQQDIRGGDITYKEDREGTRVWYRDDPPVFIAAGKPGMRSEAYRVYYNLTTGEEISRERLSSDYYAPQNDTYYIGIHERE